ncbi:cellulose binding domain-containing protein [Actinoplanes sp. NPDC020271]|uniref:cellulose binding domain-containing protein n=1 Tax=Actinoplanes sp. NPDC020271 TaxID=3363896 RepID=UPI0037874429
MNDTGTRRRSLSVVVLDGMLRLYSALQSGPTPTPKVREPGRRRRLGRWLLVTAAVAALAGTALLVVVLVRGSGDPAAPPDPAAALPGRSAPAAAAPGSPVASATPSAPATATPTTSAAARSSLGAVVTTTKPMTSASASAPAAGSTAVPLTASYRTSSVTGGLLGYKMTVTIANPGAAAKDGWTLTVTLPRSTLMVSSVSGATATQDGSTWTFVPTSSTAQVPAGGSAVISFGVTGATLIDAAPKSCTIDGSACS